MPGPRHGRVVALLVALAAVLAMGTGAGAASAASFGGALGENLAMATPALSSSGVSAWGENTYGQLGDGKEADSKVPVAVSGLTGVTAIAGGDVHSLALTSSGTVVAWGNNNTGALGNGALGKGEQRSDVPVAVSGLSGVTAIAAGEQFSLALLSNGTVMAWGINDEGQLGDGTTSGPETCLELFPCSTHPVAVSGLKGVTAIAAGEGFSLALLSNGTVMSWGKNTWGQLGDGTVANSDVPVAVSGLSGVTAIAAYADSMALLSNGTVMDWGYNGEGELGSGSIAGPQKCAESACSTTPLAVSGLSGVTAVADGGQQGLALLSNHTVMAWGSNQVGELGNGTEKSSDVPVAVSELSGVTAIAAGRYHSLALLSGGTIAAWGWNSEWQLGDGALNASQSNVPVPVSGLSGVTAIGGGGAHSLALGPPPAPLPTVTSVSPNNGPSAGGTSVTITGTNFTGATAVEFGSTSATSFTVNSETSITAVSPTGTGRVHVTVTTAEGTSPTTLSDEFIYGIPTVTKIEPDEGGRAGGTTVTITGTNFTGATAVRFGSTGAPSFKVNSETSITAVSPGGSGTVDVTVATAGGTSATSTADHFTYQVGACEDTVAPTVTGVEPAGGPATGGTSVKITGHRFYIEEGCAIEDAVRKVMFGNKEASFKWESESSITAVAPAGSGTVDVTVVTSHTSPTSPADDYTYTAVAPTVATGAASAITQTAATLNATVNPNGGEVSKCEFEYGSTATYGQSAPCAPSPGSGTSAVAVSASVAGLSQDSTYHFRVVATNSAGTSSGGDATFLTAAGGAPNVSSVKPRTGPAAGGTTVTIAGTEFGGATEVDFGSVKATSFTVESGSSITAVSPPFAGGSASVNVSVTNPHGTSVPFEMISILPESYFRYWPTVAAVAPGGGPAAGGTPVTIHGSGFTSVRRGDEFAEYVTAVRFGGTEAESYTVDSESMITAVAPPGTGTVDVTVETFAGSSPISTADRYAYSPPAPTGVCGPPGSPGGQGAASVCNWYSAGKILPAGTPRVFLLWGGFTSTGLAQTSALGEISCKTAGFGTVENPSGGGAGMGRIFGFGFYSCVAPKCEREGEEASGEPGRATVTALNLPWKQSLSVSGAPESVRNRIGAPFSGTFGRPAPGELDVKVSCETAGTGEHIKTASFEGELEPQIGIGAGPSPGLNGNPSEMAFSGAGGGALHSEAGGEGTFSGSIKYGQYFPWGSLEVW